MAYYSSSTDCCQCAEVNNINGLVTCRGCQKNYCLDHMIEHRAGLHNRFEEVTNTYDSAQHTLQILEQQLNENLTKMLSKEQKICEVKTILNQTKVQLMTRQKQENYLEEDLHRWMFEINKLKSTLNSIESNDIIKDVVTASANTCPAYRWNFYTIIFVSFVAFLLGFALPNTLNSFIIWKQSLPRIAFDQANGPIHLLENNQLAEQWGGHAYHSTFRVNRVYLEGVHHVKISFEKFNSPNTFVGIISESNKHKLTIHSPEFSSGWFIGKSRVTHNDPSMLKNLKIFFTALPCVPDVADVLKTDLLTIEIDCDNRKIVLINERSKKNFELKIDIQRHPLPWQIVFNLNYYKDRVRLRS